jgi:hypothetical protein
MRPESKNVLRSSSSGLMTVCIPPFGMLHPGKDEAEGFEKSLLSNLIRDKTREESERFSESGGVRGRLSLSKILGFLQSQKISYFLFRMHAITASAPMAMHQGSGDFVVVAGVRGGSIVVGTAVGVSVIMTVVGAEVGGLPGRILK